MRSKLPSTTSARMTGLMFAILGITLPGHIFNILCSTSIETEAQTIGEIPKNFSALHEKLNQYINKGRHPVPCNPLRLWFLQRLRH